jgi:peptide/nickel transport system permease protein
VPVWLLVSVITFMILHLAPGDPTTLILGPTASEAEILTLKKNLKLDRPIHEQYFSWVGNLFTGDFGDSIFLGCSVLEAIRRRVPVTLSLTLFAMAFALIIGIPLGVLAGIRSNTIIDTVAMTTSFIGLSIPSFVTGLLLIFLFAVKFRYMPLGGYRPFAQGVAEWAKHMIMPAFTLGFAHAALIARMTRANMIEALEQDHIVCARAKGLRERIVIWKHALRNASIPVITVIGVSLAIMLGGAFIIEIVFRLPGIGKMGIDAVKGRDYPVVQGIMMLIATFVMLVNLGIDIIYAYLDPRITYE